MFPDILFDLVSKEQVFFSGPKAQTKDKKLDYTIELFNRAK